MYRPLGPAAPPGPPQKCAAHREDSIPLTHPSLKIDLPKSRSPLKVNRLHFFEFWQFWVFLGFGRYRDQGETLPRTRFTPSALVRRSGDPNRTISMSKIRQPQQACQNLSNKFLVTSHKFQVNLSPLGGGFNLSPLGEV